MPNKTSLETRVVEKSHNTGNKNVSTKGSKRTGIASLIKDPTLYIKKKKKKTNVVSVVSDPTIYKKNK